jgi:WD40 repeat protein
VPDLAISPSGKTVGVITAQDLYVWRPPDPEPKVFHADGWLVKVAFASDELAAVASNDQTVTLFELAGGKKRVLAGHEGMVRDVAFAPDGKTLASGAEDGVVRLWELATGASRALDPHGRSVRHVAFSADGKLMASSGPDGIVHVWDVATGATHSLEPSDATALAFTGDGKLVAPGASGRTRVWSAQLGTIPQGPRALSRWLAELTDARIDARDRPRSR